MAEFLQPPRLLLFPAISRSLHVLAVLLRAMDFSSPQLRTASAAVHLFGASILAYCFAARSQSGHVSYKNWRQVPWARWCIMLVFLDSWLFHAYAGLLIQGYGVSHNQTTCTMAIYLCIMIYCLSKILIYSFLIERVYVVWPHTGSRLSSKAYCLCLLMMLGYGVVAVLMIIGRNASFEPNHNCTIGLQPFASIPLLSYDLFLNVTLTFMFLWPLQQAHFRDIRLRKIASRTLLAAFVALTTSSINIAILTIKHGEEPGWICLASCGLDVTINALVLYWVTGYRPDDQSHNNYLTTINFSIPFATHSGVLTSSRPAISTPDLAMPAPIQDKTKPYRHTPAVASRGMITSHEERVPPRDHLEAAPTPVHYDSFCMRDRTTNYPVAHTDTVESVRCERRREAAWEMEEDDDGWWWSRWWWRGRQRRRDVGDKLEAGSEMIIPFRVHVTVQEVSRFSCGNGRRESRGTEAEAEAEAEACQ